MGFLGRWRRFWRKRAELRAARRRLDELFRRPDLRRISSLRPDQRSRAVLLDYETREGAVARIRFGMIRHPQPIRVRGVHHEVLEIYEYDMAANTVAVTASRNVTRRGMPREDGPDPEAPA
jgi:hypothetical protein